MRSLRFVVSVFVLTCSSYVFAGDCTKTVMGGGCSAELDQGTAAHMRGSAKKVPEATVLSQEAKMTKERVASIHK